MREFNWRQFTWHKETKAFVVEISELRSWNPGSSIRIMGKKEAVLYRFDKTLYGPDDEIQGWELVPSSGELKRVPGCVGTKVVVFND